MRVLVTGGAGFIGSHIVGRILATGDEVLVVDDMSAGKRSNLDTRAELVQMDIQDSAFVELAQSFKPDVISHVAAQASVAVSMKEPAKDANVNIIGGLNVAKAAVESGASQVVYINTGGALYGTPDYLPCDEDHPIRPISAYGLSKWTGEAYLRMLLPPSIPLKVLRLANVYGPRQDPHGEAGVIAIFTRLMLDGKPVRIFGDGEHTRDYVYVGDVAAAHELARATHESLAVNIGCGEPTTVNELFAKLTEAVGGYALKPKYEAERPGDVRHIYLDNTRAKRVLGWKPEVSLADGLRLTIDSLRG